MQKNPDRGKFLGNDDMTEIHVVSVIGCCLVFDFPVQETANRRHYAFSVELHYYYGIILY